MTDSAMFDMPLPPPPIELQENHHVSSLSQGSDSNSLSNGHFNGNNSYLPPPPPLPPLVESDTASSSSSSLTNGLNNINNNNNNTSNGIKLDTNVKPVEEIKSTRSYLDDITKRRFVLKPTLKDSNGQDRPKTAGSGANEEASRDTIQPFVNNSDVAAIIDFIRKFRPHVCDSSDDEENSDWDE